MYGILLGVLLIAAITYWCNRTISKAAEDRLYDNSVDLPYNHTGLLLGTSKYLSRGNINPYYQYRINAAYELWSEGKIKYLVISGDNSTIHYNEPMTMRADLLKMGVDTSAIYLDYAGFRTFDSMVRLKEVFGQNAVTVISQQFHNERALYIANREGIAAVGFNAWDVHEEAGVKVQTREKFARVKVFIDYLLGTKPKFLGEKVIIPAS